MESIAGSCFAPSPCEATKERSSDGTEPVRILKTANALRRFFVRANGVFV